MGITKIFIDNNIAYTGSNSEVYGSKSNNDKIIIMSEAENVKVDQNIEVVGLPGDSSTLKFQQAGNQIQVFDLNNNLITAIPVQLDGTELEFSDGTTLLAKLDTSGDLPVMKVGDHTLRTDFPTNLDDSDIQIPYNIDYGLELKLVNITSVLNGGDPLEDSPYRGFSFYLNDKVYTIESDQIESATTYDELCKAIADELKKDPSLASLDVGLGSTFRVQDPETGKSVDGQSIVLVDSTHKNSFSALSLITEGDILSSGNFYNKIIEGKFDILNSNCEIDLDKNPDLNLEEKYSVKDDGYLTVDQDTYGVKELSSGYTWDKENITYSFNETMPEYYDQPYSGFSPLSVEQRESVREIIKEIDDLLDIDFQEVEDGGDIAFSMIDMDDATAGFAYYPGESPKYAGDVFLSTNFNVDTYMYQYEWEQTVVHEVGHALGLKHPFDGDDELYYDDNNTNLTVMSYDRKHNYVIDLSFEGNRIYANYLPVYTELYGLYDVAALDSFYTLEYSSNNINDDIYTLSFSDFDIKTIVDLGGEDTIDLSNNTFSDYIDLAPGSKNSADIREDAQDLVSFYQEVAHEKGHSEFDGWIEDIVLDNFDNDFYYTGYENLMISYETIIENLKTGSGNDIVSDNKVDNKIYTNAGNDEIHIGKGGYDYIDGGVGVDSVFIYGKNSSEVKVFKNEDDGTYIIEGDTFAAEIVSVEYLGFADSYETIDFYL